MRLLAERKASGVTDEEDEEDDEDDIELSAEDEVTVEALASRPP